MTLSSPVVLNCLPTSRRLLSAILFLPGPITLTCARNIPFPPGILFPFRNCGLILFLWCHRKIPLCMSSLWFRCAPKPVFPLWCPNMSALPTPLSVTLIPAWKFLLQIPICGTVADTYMRDSENQQLVRVPIQDMDSTMGFIYRKSNENPLVPYVCRQIMEAWEITK